MKTLIICITFIWVGMVLGISFLEAPLKFTAPNITLKLGLGIGKVVFGALNKIEIIFSLILITSFFIGNFPLKSNYAYGVVVLILLMQSLWLIPVLNHRADLIIAEEKVSESYHHILFIILELIKLLFLTIAGIKFLNSCKQF